MEGREIRKIILQQSKRAGVGHIGSALSIADLIASLYGGVLKIDAPRAADRDRFILGKGHAALALYAALHLRGWISVAQLDTFCGDDSLLGVHPEHALPGVDFCTGSLGQGLSYAVGAALAARLDGSSRQIYALVSDAECNEGSVWEATMLAAQHRLANLTVLVDFNQQQAFGYTKDVINQSNLAERFRAFGLDTQEIDGHDLGKLTSALTAPRKDLPRVFVAHTVFGKGVSYMERQIKWHYMPMNDAEFERALMDIAS